MAVKGVDFKPQVHPEIATLEAFVETFLFFFSQGSNAEFVSLDKELFFLFHDRLVDNKVSFKSELGGHASVWALRAQAENCKVFATPWPSTYYKQNLLR